MIDNSKLIIPALKNVKSESRSSATLTISPLQNGYGRTLGNSIRRTLLSSIPGSGVTGFSIEGVSNEFSTIDGVLEDVVDITLNLKQIRLSSTSDEPITLILTKKGKGELKAGDIEKSAEVEVANPDLVICNVTDSKITVAITIQIEAGVGYVRAEAQKRVKSNMIPLDTVFSPVTRVRYSVKDTRKGQNAELDELIMTVDTDGTVSPDKSFEMACGILMQQYQILAAKSAEVFDLTEAIDNDSLQPDADSQNENLTRGIEDIGLKSRTLKALQDAGVKTVAELLQYSDSDLLALSGFGKGALEEAKEVLSGLGF